jgi:oligopeptidase B
MAVWYSGDYMYYSRENLGMSHVIYYRKHVDSKDSRDQMILGLNKSDDKVGNIGMIKIGKDETLLAFTVYSTGNERYTLHVKNLVSGEILENSILDVAIHFEWSVTANSIVYMRVNKSGNPTHFLSHMINEPISKDK